MGLEVIYDGISVTIYTAPVTFTLPIELFKVNELANGTVLITIPLVFDGSTGKVHRSAFQIGYQDIYHLWLDAESNVLGTYSLKRADVIPIPSPSLDVIDKLIDNDVAANYPGCLIDKQEDGVLVVVLNEVGNPFRIVLYQRPHHEEPQNSPLWREVNVYKFELRLADSPARQSELN
jgi:hypothetical protein